MDIVCPVWCQIRSSGIALKGTLACPLKFHLANDGDVRLAMRERPLQHRAFFAKAPAIAINVANCQSACPDKQCFPGVGGRYVRCGAARILAEEHESTQRGSSHPTDGRIKRTGGYSESALNTRARVHRSQGLILDITGYHSFSFRWSLFSILNRSPPT